LRKKERRGTYPLSNGSLGMRHIRVRSTISAMIGAFAACSLPAIAQPSFTGLGDLSGGTFSSIASGVSADGSVVVGSSSSAFGFEAFRWTQGGGMMGLGDLPDDPPYGSAATGVSADGSIVVGSSAVDIESSHGGPPFLTHYRPFRWTQGGGMVDLGLLRPAQDETGFGYAVSADGSVIVGMSGEREPMTVPHGKAFRWSAGGGMEGMGVLSGYSYSDAFESSDDGSVIVGRSWSGAHTFIAGEAVRWSPASGLVGLGDLPGGNVNSAAYDVSADGAVVVGRGSSDSGTQAIRWTPGGGMVGLGVLTALDWSAAEAVSADGSVVVGYSRNSSNSGIAFICDMTHGMRNLQDVLINDLGLGASLAGWTLTEANDISANGKFIVGTGINPNGNTEAWIAGLGQPRCDFDGDSHCEITDLNLMLAEGPIANGVPVIPGVNEQFDLNGDGMIDANDVDHWLSIAALHNGLGSAYKYGDANLDGIVDGSDFNLWNANKFTLTLAWDEGEFNGDGAVDGSDFGLWNTHKFTASDGVASVPEPGWLGVLTLFAALPLARRVSRRATRSRTAMPIRLQPSVGLLEDRRLLSMDLGLLKDINAMPSVLGSNPGEIVDASGVIFVTAMCGFHFGKRCALLAVGVVLVTLSGTADAEPYFMGLGDLPGGTFSSYATGVSADGSVVVGRSSSAPGPQAFRWTQSGGVVGLGRLPGNTSTFFSSAEAVSDDGSVVVGQSYYRMTWGGPGCGCCVPRPGAFRWTEAHSASMNTSTC
jgi:probable HAF family extracellular repeat protein